MNREKVLRELISLPPEAQKQVIDFIAFLQTRYLHPRPVKKARQPKLTDEHFIGIWRDRQDMQDSTAWVRSARKSEWVGPHE